MQEAEILQIVLAEDNSGDVGLVREALDAQDLNYELQVNRNGEQMLRFLEAIDRDEAEAPDLIILDLNLPRVDGGALLKRIRECQRCADVPLIVITSSDSPHDRGVAAKAKVDHYFRKPADFDEFMLLGEIVRNMMSG